MFIFTCTQYCFTAPPYSLIHSYFWTLTHHIHSQHHHPPLLAPFTGLFMAQLMSNLLRNTLVASICNLIIYSTLISPLSIFLPPTLPLLSSVIQHHNFEWNHSGSICVGVFQFYSAHVTLSHLLPFLLLMFGLLSPSLVSNYISR